MRHVKVPHPQRGIVPFVPWDYQAELARDTRRAVLVNKGRQLGISTALCSARAAHKVTHVDGTTIGIVSRKGDTGAELMSMVAQAIRSAAQTDKTVPHISKENQMNLVFRGRPIDGITQPFNSRVICETASPHALRTYTASEVILDEYAFMEYPREILRSSWPTLSRGGSLLIVSTPPEQPGSMFEQMWNETDSPFVRYKLPWPVCPEFTKAWAEEARKRMGARAFAQEHECDFAAAGRPYFPRDTIEKCYAAYDEHGTPPSAQSGEPEPGHRYLIAADVAGGGEDFTVIGVWDISKEPWTLVWHYEYERIGSRELQQHLDRVTHQWGADLVVDASGMGEMLLGQLHVPAVGLRIVGGYSWREGDGIISVAKDKLLSHALICMDQGRVALPRVARMDQELRQYVIPDAHVMCDWVMMVAIALWRADEDLMLGNERTELVTLADIMPNFRPVRATEQRQGTDDLWMRGL